MNDYLLLMHDDAEDATKAGADGAWAAYLEMLRASACFDGGSAIGGGICVRKTGQAGGITPGLGGYLRVRAASLEDARRFLDGNPVFEAGGTVEIRELPRS